MLLQASCASGSTCGSWRRCCGLDIGFRGRGPHENHEPLSHTVLRAGAPRGRRGQRSAGLRRRSRGELCAASAPRLRATPASGARLCLDARLLGLRRRIRLLLGAGHLGARAHPGPVMDSRILGFRRRPVRVEPRLLGPDGRLLRRHRLRLRLLRRRVCGRLLARPRVLLQPRRHPHRQRLDQKRVRPPDREPLPRGKARKLQRSRRRAGAAERGRTGGGQGPAPWLDERTTAPSIGRAHAAGATGAGQSRPAADCGNHEAGRLRRPRSHRAQGRDRDAARRRPRAGERSQCRRAPAARGKPGVRLTLLRARRVLETVPGAAARRARGSVRAPGTGRLRRAPGRARAPSARQLLRAARRPGPSYGGREAPARGGVQPHPGGGGPERERGRG